MIYSIQRVRDGKSYATRIVKATQRGKAIFVCSCSFVKPDDSVTLSHQVSDNLLVMNTDNSPKLD